MVGEETHLKKETAVKPPGRGDDTGDILFVFRRKRYLLVVVLWAMGCTIIVGASGAFLRELASDPEGWFFIAGFLLFPMLVLLLYVSYLSVFDNIIIFERGLFPPMGSEGFLNGLLMRRTFIPFTAIRSFHLMDSTMGRFIIAQGRSWPIPKRWDLNLLEPLIKTGIRETYLAAPQPPFR